MRYNLPEGPDHITPEYIVVHAMGEFIQEKPAWEFLGSLGLSAHAFITPSGVTVRSRKERQGAWHCRAQGYNFKSLGIEFLVPGEHDIVTFNEVMTSRFVWATEDQFTAGAMVVADWCNVYNLSPFHHVKRHSEIDPENKNDPGHGFPWPEFIHLVAEKYNGLVSRT